MLAVQAWGLSMGRKVNHNFLDAQQPSRATSAMRGSPYPCHSALRQLLQTLPVASCTSTSLRRCSELQRFLDAAPVDGWNTIVCHKAAFATQCLTTQMCPGRATCRQCKPGESQAGRNVNLISLTPSSPHGLQAPCAATHTLAIAPSDSCFRPCRLHRARARRFEGALSYSAV